MWTADSSLQSLIEAIIADDHGSVHHLLDQCPALAYARLETGATRARAADFFIDEIKHYLYAGDTPLHVAAAAYRPALVPVFVVAGADVGVGNRRGARPLHYAADGAPGSSRRDPDAQRETVVRLIAAGADPNTTDLGGATPLHRAIRNRCAGAVGALLEGGADPDRASKSGSTPMRLALIATGRGGSGTASAKGQQAEIVRLLREHGATE